MKKSEDGDMYLSKIVGGGDDFDTGYGHSRGDNDADGDAGNCGNGMLGGGSRSSKSIITGFLHAESCANALMLANRK